MSQPLLTKRRLLIGLVLAVVALGGVFNAHIVDLFKPTTHPTSAAKGETNATPVVNTAAKRFRLSTAARKNLGIESRRIRLQTYWRSVLIPGEVVDRPGLTDRAVSAPAVGIVTAVHAVPGDTVHAGQELFTLRLFSEYLQNSQSELLKATRECEIVQESIDRLDKLAKDGSIPPARMTELSNQLRRQQSLILALRQDLLARGLTPKQVDGVSRGEFVNYISITAPQMVPSTTEATIETPSGASPRIGSKHEGESPSTESPASHDSPGNQPPSSESLYEVQELAVELGQQIQAGQLMARLSNHQSLYIVGHAFKQEAVQLEQVAQKQREIGVEFSEGSHANWPDLNQKFLVRHLSNTADTESRTFDFFIPLQNQSRQFGPAESPFLVWRFHPGQRVRLFVPVEEFPGVYVVPSAAIVKQGANVFVFQQNGDLFQRHEVQIAAQDRNSVAIVDDGSLKPGMYIVQSAAAALLRIDQSQSATREPAGFHVHADGTVHGAH